MILCNMMKVVPCLLMVLLSFITSLLRLVVSEVKLIFFHNFWALRGKARKVSRTINIHFEANSREKSESKITNYNWNLKHFCAIKSYLFGYLVFSLVRCDNNFSRTEEVHKASSSRARDKR